MSFRIKLTDPSLRQDIPSEPKSAFSSFSNALFGNYTEEKKSFIPENISTKVSKPNQGSDKGLAIRQVPLAQADHM